jgi:hypothetical protein
MPLSCRLPTRDEWGDHDDRSERTFWWSADGSWHGPGSAILAAPTLAELTQSVCLVGAFTRKIMHAVGQHLFAQVGWLLFLGGPDVASKTLQPILCLKKRCEFVPVDLPFIERAHLSGGIRP